MCKLRTVWPYGLNDKCKGQIWTNVDENVYVARELLSGLPSRSQFKKRGHKPTGLNLTAVDVLQEINTSCKCGIIDISCVKCVFNFMQCKVQTLSRSVAKGLAYLSNELLYDLPLPQQYYLALLDMINSKFLPKQTKNEKATKKKPSIFCKIFFCDKHVNDSGIPRILREAIIKKTVKVGNLSQQEGGRSTRIPTS